MKKSNKKLTKEKGHAIISVARAIRLGWVNFWRNSFLSFATVIVMAVILFIFNIILGIQFISNQALASLSERVDIVMYLHDDIDALEAANLTKEIEQIPGVKTVKFISKQEALETVAKTHPETANFLVKFNITNPLPPSINITTNSTKDYEAIQERLSQSQYTGLINNYIAKNGNAESMILSQVAANLRNISNWVEQIVFWMVFTFIIGGALIVINAIQITIYNRREEIYVMRLVGATPHFIRLPFITEALLYGCCAMVISIALLIIISQSIHLDTANLWDYYPQTYLVRAFIIEFIITVILSVTSSFSATQQYLQKGLNLN